MMPAANAVASNRTRQYLAGGVGLIVLAVLAFMLLTPRGGALSEREAQAALKEAQLQEQSMKETPPVQAPVSAPPEGAPKGRGPMSVPK